MEKEDDVKVVNNKAEEPMKIYDKYMYKSQEKMKSIILIIFVFIIGFISGYVCQYNTIEELQEQINEIHQEQINE